MLSECWEVSYTWLMELCNGDDELGIVTWNPKTWAKNGFGDDGSSGGLVDTFQEEMLGLVGYFPVGCWIVGKSLPKYHI